MKKIYKGGDAVKTYSRRDGATAALKAIGLQTSDYAQFVVQTTDGRWAARIEAAQAYLDSKLRKVAKLGREAKNRGKSAKSQRGNTTHRQDSVAATIRAHILAGLSNAEVFAAVQKSHGLGDDKAHYPSWYRSRMKRDGLLPETTRRDAKPIAEPKTRVTPQPTGAGKPVGVAPLRASL